MDPAYPVCVRTQTSDVWKFDRPDSSGLSRRRAREILGSIPSIPSALAAFSFPEDDQRLASTELIVPRGICHSVNGPAEEAEFSGLANADFCQGLLWADENISFLAETKIVVMCLGTSFGVMHPWIYSKDGRHLSAGLEEFDCGWVCYGKLGFLTARAPSA